MRIVRAVYAASVAIVLGGLLGGGAGLARAEEPPVLHLPVPGTMAPSDAAVIPAAETYRLRLYQLHTRERLDVVYRIGDEYVPSAVEKLNQFLRDYRTETVSSYDLKEFDLLHTIMARLGRPNGVIDIVCGYRTPETNEHLRHGTAESGVAEHSQHMLAKAIDMRVPGVSTARLRDTALSLQAGGVGYYPVSRFVHVDVGPVRTWSFGGGSGGRLRRAGPNHRAHSRHAVLHREGE
jgi:uncharacterized protein YcbK (DUF882 family)